MSVYFLNMPLGKITTTSVAHILPLLCSAILYLYGKWPDSVQGPPSSPPQSLPNSSLATLIKLSIAVSMSEVSFWRQVTHLEAFSLGDSGPWPTEAMGKVVLGPHPEEFPDSGDAQLSTLLLTPHSNPRAPGTMEFSVLPTAPSSQQHSLSSYLFKNVSFFFFSIIDPFSIALGKP